MMQQETIDKVAKLIIHIARYFNLEPTDIVSSPLKTSVLTSARWYCWYIAKKELGLTTKDISTLSNKTTRCIIDARSKIENKLKIYGAERKAYQDLLDYIKEKGDVF